MLGQRGSIYLVAMLALLTASARVQAQDCGELPRTWEGEAFAVDFGITQVVDGNWGVHAIVRKDIFPA